MVRPSLRLAACLAILASPVLGAQEALEEVVISATPLHQSPLETAQPAIVLSGEELSRQLALSLGETLASQPGITGTYFGPVASRPIIRGQGGPRVQMLSDGMSSLDVSSISDDHAVAIDPLIARGVEVIKGPGTLMFGNAAVGGVVNVDTGRIASQPLDAPLAGAVELRGDSATSERSGAARLDASVGAFVLHADGFRRQSDDIDIPGFALSHRLVEELAEEGETDPVNPHGRVYGTSGETDGGALAASWVGEKGHLGVAVSRHQSDYGTPGPETQPDGSSVRIGMRQERYDLSGSYVDPLPGITELHLGAAHVDYDHQEFEPDGEAGTRFAQDGTEIRASAEHAFGSWRGAIGLQYRDIDFEAVGEEAFVPAHSTRNAGVFVYEERPIGALQLELGLRYERQDIDPAADSGYASRTGDGLSGSAGLVWKFADDYAASLNLTQARREPDATELFADGLHVALARYEMGDASLAAETTRTADLAFRRTQGRLTYTLSAYYSQYDDYIYAQPTGEYFDDDGELFPIVQYQQRDARFHGFEAELLTTLYDRHALDVTLRLAGDYVRGTLDGGDSLPLMPPWKLGGELQFEREAWQGSVSVFQYADHDDVAPNELPTDGYTLIDAQLTFRPRISAGNLSLFCKGSNLANEEIRRSTSPVKDYAPLPGRSLTLGARYEF